MELGFTPCSAPFLFPNIILWDTGVGKPAHWLMAPLPCCLEKRGEEIFQGPEQFAAFDMLSCRAAPVP